MKRFQLIALLLMLAGMSAHSEKKLCLGFTGDLEYSDYFNISIEPTVGVEFNDVWALGSGLGVGYVGGDADRVLFIVEPFLRGTLWHNEIFHIDIKADVAWGFIKTTETEKHYGMENNYFQGGLIPAFRFRANDHWDFSADLGFLGVIKDYLGKWEPTIGIKSFGFWINYRF